MSTTQTRRSPACGHCSTAPISAAPDHAALHPCRSGTNRDRTGTGSGANLALVNLVTKVAERKNATVGQVALAWLLAQKPWIVPIPGTRRLERLDENLESANLDLTAEDLAELDQASASVQIQGDRYPEAMQKMIDR